jgi:S1-C subfamily serine protease
MNIKIIILANLLVSFQAYANLFNSDQKMFTENEKNSVSVFENTVNSVVNVSSISTRSQRSSFFFDLPDSEVPAGAGSGFIWNKEGYIVTNFHVIQSGQKFQISFHNDKKVYSAKLIGVEPKKDIAVLKLIKPPEELSPIQVGRSKDLRVGQKTLAIGNPFGLDHTMTTGIVSAVGRKVKGIGGVKIHDMIQTDAAINPGNSGGPLINSRGELIGMNTQILSGSGTSSGVGFAVPVDTVKRIVPEIMKHGKVIRPGLGIGILPEHIKNRFGVEKGIVISHVDPKGGAAKAGLQGVGQDKWGNIYLGDIIIKIDGNPVDSFDDIYHALDKYKVGDSVNVEYIRDEEKENVKLKLMEL